MITLIGRSKKYHKEKEKGKIPPDLKEFKHSLRWPLDLETQEIHLSCYFNEKNYSAPEDKDHEHKAVDIQVKAGTPIYVPETARVVYYSDFDLRGLGDIILWGEKTGIVYVFAHLDKESIAPKIKECSFFDRYRELHVREGESIGCIGTWRRELQKSVQVPPDVVRRHKREYHHLHFATHDYSHGRMPHSVFLEGEVNAFNPLLVLRDLE